MKKYNLPANNLYGNKPVELNFPDTWEVNVYSFNGEMARELSQKEIADKINSPEGVPPIATGARGCNDAVLILEDITRPTPLAPIVHEVIKQLELSGVPRANIRFIIATGMHRALSREDLVRKLDEELVSEFRIYSHSPFYNNAYVGHSIKNIPIEINTDVVRAAYKIGIGSMFAHPHTGIGGGAKILVPGVASLETIRQFHLYPGGRWNMESNMLAIANRAAELLGLDFKIDAMLNGSGAIAELFCGHWSMVGDNHLDEIRQFFYTKRPPAADLVISNNYFKPTEPAFAYSDPTIFDLVKPGGDIVISSHTPQGSAPHYLFGRWGDNGIAGYLNEGRGVIPEHIRHYFAFSTYPDRGVAEGYHLDETKHIWACKWDDILHKLGNEPRSVAILPYVTVAWME